MTFLGIDAGASSTKWALSDGHAILAHGSLEAMDGHIYRDESQARMDRVLQEIAARVSNVARVYAGITGISDQTRERILEKISHNFPGAQIVLMTDIELAYRAHFAPGEGIFLYAGTGSVALHITEDNQVIQIGGWGYLLGDEGGGYWIGRQAIRHILQRLDHGLELDKFAEEILGTMNSYTWDEIKSFVYSQNRNAIAALSKEVFRLADEGNPDAQEILRSAGKELAHLVATMALRIDAKDLPVVFAGGISREGSPVWNSLSAHLASRLIASDVNIAARAAQLAGNL